MANIRALAIYIRKYTDILLETTKEIAIDAIYGTKSADMQIFAVLAKLNGTEVPLVYLLLGKSHFQALRSQVLKRKSSVNFCQTLVNYYFVAN